MDNAIPIVPLLALVIFSTNRFPNFTTLGNLSDTSRQIQDSCVCIAEFSSVPNAKIQDFHFSRSSVALCQRFHPERSLDAWQNESGLGNR